MVTTAPTFVAEYETAFNTSTSPKTTASFNAVAGDYLICVGLSEDANFPLSTPTNTQGALTWSLKQSIVVSSYCTNYIWTAPVTSTMTGMTVSNARASGHFGINVLHYRDSDGIGTSVKANASGAPSISITASANSALITSVSDWNAVSGASRTWRTINVAATEQSYVLDAGLYGIYVARYTDAGTAGSKTAGLSAPTGMKYSVIALEVLGKTTATIPQGIASASITISNTALGVSTRHATSNTSLSVTSNNIGKSTRFGSNSTVLSLASSTTGKSTRTSFVSSVLPVPTTVTGHSNHIGQADSQVVLDTIAQGESIQSGNVISALSILPVAEGSSNQAGSVTFELDIIATAVGSAPTIGVPEGSATANVNIIAEASGYSNRSGSTEVDLAFTGAATGTTTKHGYTTSVLTVEDDIMGVSNRSGLTSTALVMTVRNNEMARPTLPTIGQDNTWGQPVLDGLNYAFDTAEEALADAAAAQTTANTKLTDASSQTTRWRGIYANAAALPSGVAGDFAVTLA